MSKLKQTYTERREAEEHHEDVDEVADEHVGVHVHLLLARVGEKRLEELAHSRHVELETESDDLYHDRFKFMDFRESDSVACLHFFHQPSPNVCHKRKEQ